MSLNTNKDLKQFYSIGEVAAMFEVNETTLRFWEKEFPQIAPQKMGKARRYTKADVEQVRLVHGLVKVCFSKHSRSIMRLCFLARMDVSRRVWKNHPIST